MQMFGIFVIFYQLIFITIILAKQGCVSKHFNLQHDGKKTDLKLFIKYHGEDVEI